MFVALLLLSLTVQFAIPLAPGELAELCKLLKVTESLPGSEYGELTSEFTAPSEDEPGNRTTAVFRYRYAIDGEKVYWFQDWFDGNGGTRRFLHCRNDRHEFAMEHTPRGWINTQFEAKGGSISKQIRSTSARHSVITTRFKMSPQEACSPIRGTE